MTPLTVNKVKEALEQTMLDMSRPGMGDDVEIVHHWANFNMFSGSDESYHDVDLYDFATRLLEKLVR